LTLRRRGQVGRKADHNTFAAPGPAAGGKPVEQAAGIVAPASAHFVIEPEQPRREKRVLALIGQCAKQKKIAQIAAIGNLADGRNCAPAIEIEVARRRRLQEELPHGAEARVGQEITDTRLTRSHNGRRQE